jgi:hypothetical protein
MNEAMLNVIATIPLRESMSATPGVIERHHVGDLEKALCLADRRRLAMDAGTTYARAP